MKIITGSKGELQDIYKVELKANLHKGCSVDFFLNVEINNSLRPKESNCVLALGHIQKNV